MSRAVVVHYHEIGLKGRNRSFFERALIRNLSQAIAGCSHGRVKSLPGRLVIGTPEPPEQALLDAVGRTFGVAGYAPAIQTPATVEAMTQAALELLAPKSFSTFAIAARRGTKELALTSRDINVALGSAVQTATGAGVNLNAPDVTVHVEVVGSHAFVYVDRQRGPGGLPVGVSGRVMSLLSGGIDSAVATHRILKRGARASLVHFHSFPFTDRAGARKAEEIARIVASWQGDTILYLVPLAEAQQRVVATGRPALRVILYRRFMMRIAGELARQEGAKALVTGESLGQVASQTLENLICVEQAADVPLLRPLIGDDKQDIVDEARRIGTFEVSILPYEDCCSLFLPRSPATRAGVDQCLEAEAELDVAGIVDDAVGRTETIRVARPGCGEA